MANKNEQHDAEHKDEGKPHPGAGPAAQTPQQDHTPRQEEAAAREKQETGASQQAAAAPKVDEQAAAAAKEAQAAGSIGAQVILDFNGDGSLGARGGISGIMNENVAARDAHLVALGLDPVGPSGPPPPLAVRKAHEEAAKIMADAQAKVDAAHATPGSGAASRVSSLAAGLITEPADVPIAPPPGAQAAHK
jgi:hypothetical protein